MSETREAAFADALAEQLHIAEQWMREAYVLMEGAIRHIAAGYNSGVSTKLRELHGRLPLHLHPADCDGCLFGAYS